MLQLLKLLHLYLLLFHQLNLELLDLFGGHRPAFDRGFLRALHGLLQAVTDLISIDVLAGDLLRLEPGGNDAQGVSRPVYRPGEGRAGEGLDYAAIRLDHPGGGLARYRDGDVVRQLLRLRRSG